MAGTNTTYIAKNAAPLVNPTGTAAVFTTTPSAIATVATTQLLKPAYIVYKAYAQGGSGSSNNINYVNIAVRAGGRVTTGASSTFVPSLLLADPGATPPALVSNTNLTVPNAVTLGSLTAATYATTSGVWSITANLVWAFDSGIVSGTISGNQTTSAGETVTAATAVTPASGYTIVPPLTTLPTTAAQAAAQINNGGELPLFFMIAGLFGTSNAGNFANLDAFGSDAL